MAQINILAITAAVEKQQKSIWHKLLPALLFVSFAVANIYNVIMAANSTAIYTAAGGYESLYIILLYTLIDYIVYRIVFWFYTLILNRSVFAMCIPFIIFKDQFQACYIVKNVILGFVALLCMQAPYLLSYIPVLGLALSLSIIPVIFAIDKKTFIPDLVAHNVFRAYAVPYFIYFFIDVISFIMEVV